MQKKLYELKENPLSIAIYGEAEDVSDLVKSIKETGLLTPLLIKSDGTILSGHRRYRAARQAGLILVNVEVRDPKDKAEEELIIISANKQREKTATQLFREDERLRAIYGEEGRKRMSESAKTERAERKQKCDPDKNEGFSDFEKPLAPNAENQPEQPFGIEGIYNEAMARTENANKSQMQHSSVESPHSTGQTQPKPEPINMNKRIAKELGLSTGALHQLRTVGEAAKAGVPEAQDALKRADAGEITLNRAYEITKKATTPEKPIQIPFSEGAAAIPGTALYEFYKRAKPVGAWVEELKAQLRQNSPDMTLNTAYSLSGFVAVELLRYRELSAEIEDYIARHGGEDIEQDEDEY